MKIKKIVNNKFIKRLIKFTFGILTDKQIVRIQYRVVLNRKLNLNEPKRFTEKIQWYKLYYRDSLMTEASDKYLVRDYLQRKGYDDLLVELYQVGNTFEDFNFEELPNEFIIKSNKGSGTNIIVKNKMNIKNGNVKKEMKSWNSVNTVLYGREWAYKNIKSKIIIEELLKDEKNPSADIDDYKIMTFGGIAKYIWVDSDRNTKHKRTFFDLDWNMLNIESDVPTSDLLIPKPKSLEKMIKIAEDIGKDFPFARIDFYWINEKIYFGEITFYPWSGCVQFSPDSFDYTLGDMFKLPSKQLTTRSK